MATGYVFDEIFAQHDYPGHPENAKRLAVSFNYLTEHNFLPKLDRIPARPATFNELTYAHHPTYIEMVEDTCRFGGGMLDADTYTTSASFEAATRAVGGLIDLTAAVVKGDLEHGFALIRPPGHHAIPSRAMGFCLFGNVVIAARTAQARLGIERVAIVDFDVHHGNGTQAMLNEDATILFISSHQYPFYPGTGALTETGLGPAKGTIVNIPLAIMTGDEGVKRLYREVTFPVLHRFQPQLILVSAGFDAHWDDPLANLGLTLKGYHWLCQELIALAGDLCQGRIVFTLEGGYNLRVLASAIGNTFRVLLDHAEVDDPVGISPWAEPDVSALLENLKRIHNL